MLLAVKHFDFLQFAVEVLVNAVQYTFDPEVIFELNRYHFRFESLEEGEEQHASFAEYSTLSAFSAWRRKSKMRLPPGKGGPSLPP